MFIKRLKPYVYDVFYGNGWDNWTRVRRLKDGNIQVIAGSNLPTPMFLKVKERVFK